MPALPVGNYSVRVEKTGFKTQVQNNVAVAAGATVRLDVLMEVGATQQTIEVASPRCDADYGQRAGKHGGIREACKRTAADRKRRRAQPVRSGRYHGGSCGQLGIPTSVSAEAGLALLA